MLLKWSYSFSLNADRAPQLKASVGRLSFALPENMKHSFRLLFIAILVVLFASKAYPCSCSGNSLRREYRKARVVFIGQLVEIGVKRNDALYPLRFKVEKLWKGEKNTEIVVLSEDVRIPEGIRLCGFNLESGERYLVFAYGQKLQVYTACSYTSPAATAPSIIKKLNGFWFRSTSKLFPS